MLGKIIAFSTAKAIARGVVSGALGATQNLGGRDKTAEENDTIKVCISAEEFSDRDYREVINILIANGFTNIQVNEIRDLKNSFFDQYDYGQVSRVSINGKEEFEEDDVFPAGAYVLVDFHLYVDSPSPDIPELEALKKRSFPEPEAPIVCEYCDCTVDKGITKCPYCGAPIDFGTCK